MSDVPETQVISVETPTGPGRWFVDAATDPVATVLLGHGAGGGVTAADLSLLARELPRRNVTVARFEQPWRTAGGRVAVAPARLDLGWRAAVDFAEQQPWCSARLLFGGRSAGARVACRTAVDYELAGVVCLAFPLHLPGRPEKSRLPELLLPTVPRLVLQGSLDSFGGTAELAAVLGGASGVRLVDLPGADHSYRLPKGSPFTPADLRARLVAEVAAFCRG